MYTLEVILMYEESVAVEFDKIFRYIRKIDYCLDVRLGENNKSLYTAARYDIIKYIFCIANNHEKAAEFVKLYLKCNVNTEYKQYCKSNFDGTIYTLKEYINLFGKEATVIDRVNKVLETIYMMYVIKMENGSSETSEIKKRSKILTEDIVSALKK